MAWRLSVTDTGSTDRTREIAEKYADKVVDFAWIKDFSAARNYCASFASNNWILALDCDEFVNAIDIKILRMLMQKYPRHTGVLRLKNITHDDKGQAGYVNTDLTRFYNKKLLYVLTMPFMSRFAQKISPSEMIQWMLFCCQWMLFIMDTRLTTRR